MKFEIDDKTGILIKLLTSPPNRIMDIATLPCSSDLEQILQAVKKIQNETHARQNMENKKNG